MSNAKPSPTRAREQAVFRYRNALERGDFETVAAVLKMAERDPILWAMIDDLSNMEEGALERPAAQPSRLPRNDKHIIQVITVRDPTANGQTPKPNHSQEDTDMKYIAADSFVPERPRTLYPFAVRFITLAAALFIVVLLGGLLIEMVNDPIDGYPALVSLQTEEPTAEPCDTSTDYMVQAETHITAGDYGAALGAYNCAIEVDPGNNAAYLLRGGLVGANGDYDLMGYDLYTFNTHNPVGVNSLLEVPVADILPTLRSAIESRPDDAVLYLLRGLVLNRVALSGGADFIRFHELAPDNAAGYLFHWTYPFSQEDENIQKAIQLAPDSALLIFTLWGNLTEQNVEFVKPFVDSAIQADSTHLFAYNMRGQVEVILGDTAAATSDFYQHIQNNQTDVTEIEGLTFGKSLTSDVVSGGVYRLPFTAQAGQKLNVKATRSDGISGLGPTVVVLNPAGEVMPAPYTIGANLSVSPPIERLEIPESGVYALLVKANSVNPMIITVVEESS